MAKSQYNYHTVKKRKSKKTKNIKKPNNQFDKDPVSESQSTTVEDEEED